MFLGTISIPRRAGKRKLHQKSRSLAIPQTEQEGYEVWVEWFILFPIDVIFSYSRVMKDKNTGLCIFHSVPAGQIQVLLTKCPWLATFLISCTQQQMNRPFLPHIYSLVWQSYN